ncbi:uncharacterized protein MEPE_00871 [Melanopsichium pennsylvanicum]|uniref:Uncharacterized protein n=2 Tax=Melanopsichium pennsylvanicum TaxID=63383 RepID=A0AAJ4XHE9_9BASI|nr:c2h2 type zinc finger domain protein [Melanopsichium pennsylvanicum 4]SNX82165.1 uncharacterized protein MEPE_00871 [Melanopsichium pennsylvanicum]
MNSTAAVSHKRGRLRSSPSDTDDNDSQDNVDTSCSPSTASGTQIIACGMSSQSHHYQQARANNLSSAVPRLKPAAQATTASSSSLSTDSRKHRCDLCSKTFARHEHVLRHRASHTDTASFSCDDCGKLFRRNDVLQRHRRLHVARKALSLDVSNSKLSKRQRSALARVESACLRCSSKKLKCDAVRPSCSRCTRKADVTCVYPSSSDEPSLASTMPRNRSVSILDDSWMLHSSTNLNHTADEGSSQITTSKSYPSQAQSSILASVPAHASSIDASSIDASSIDASTHSQATASPAQKFYSFSTASSEQQVQFSAPLPSASLLPALAQFPTPALSNAHSSYPSHDSPALPASVLSQTVIGATPGLIDVVRDAAPDFQTACKPDNRVLTGIIDWLDGSQPSDLTPAGQHDFIFGDSPEAPHLLDWSQMQDWADFDLAVNSLDGVASSVSQSSSAAPALDQQPVALNLRHTSINAPLQQQSPLFMLSSAAEVFQESQRLSQTQIQQAHPTASPRGSFGSSLRSIDHAQSVAAAGEPRAIAGGRSRWNSPDTADEDTVPNDSIRSDPLDAGRNAKTGPHSDAASLNHLPRTAARHIRSPTVRSAAAREAWPNRWNPTIKLNSLPSFSFVKASEEHSTSEDLAHVKRVSHSAMLRMIEHLRNAASDPLEQKRFDAAFATLDAATLNVYLQLFFTHCYSYLPAIHQVTFDPDRCDPRLLAALCAVGAFFSKVPGSRSAAIYLAGLVQMSVSRATVSNHALARVTTTFQAILLIHMVWRSVGIPSRQEYAEAFRATYCTMVRRCRLLEEIPPPKLPADATIEDRWTAWVKWETGRRTAWSILVSETELSLHWNLPEPFAPNEITGKLPCDDQLWEASSAIEWAQTAMALSPTHTGLEGDAGLLPDLDGQPVLANFTWPSDACQLNVMQVCDMIQRAAESQSPGSHSSATDVDKGIIAKLSPFSRLCVGSAVLLSTHHTMKMVRFCSMLLGDEEQARERMSIYLAAATRLLSFDQARDARVDLLLHAIQLFQLISSEKLQLLSCRRGVSRMQAARQKLSRELNVTKTWKTASIVFHAAQILRLAKQSLQRAPVECLHIFYASIALHAVSLLVLQRDAHAPQGQIVRITFNGTASFAAPPPPSSHASYDIEARRADSTASGSPSSIAGGSTFSTSGTSITGNTLSERRCPLESGSKTTYMLESVGNLRHPLAPVKVLSLSSKWLRADDGMGVWPIGQSLAKILDSLATLTPQQCEG